MEKADKVHRTAEYRECGAVVEEFRATAEEDVGEIATLLNNAANHCHVPAEFVCAFAPEQLGGCETGQVLRIGITSNMSALDSHLDVTQDRL